MQPVFVRVLPARAVPLAAIVLLAAAPLGAQDFAYITRLGTDTLSAERFTRTATHIEGDLVRRLPAAAQWHYSVDLDSDGLPLSLRLTPVRGGPAATFRLRSITADFGRDSATLLIERDTVARRRIAAPHAIPMLPESFGFFDLWGRWLRATGRDTGTVFAVAPLGGPQGPLRIRLGRDSGAVAIIGGSLRTRHAPDGGLLSLDGSETTLKYTAERVARVDLDRVFVSFAARDSASGPTGNFISRRDTVRATVAGAQLWVDYGRPATRGRNVFAHGVLGDTLWRTGANAATQLRTDRDLELNGRVLPAGLYSLFTHIDGPAAELVINAQTGQWGTQYDRARDVMRVPLRRAPASPPVELFTIAVAGGGGPSGTLSFAWGDAVFSVPFVVK